MTTATRIVGISGHHYGERGKPEGDLEAGLTGVSDYLGLGPQWGDERLVQRD